MSDSKLITLSIQVTEEQHKKLEQLAQENGFPTVDDYLRALIDSDAFQQEIDPIEAFREGWQDAISGNTFPASTLWDDLDDEPTD